MNLMEIEMTPNERRAIQGILDSDYMDGEKTWPGVGKYVWTWSANPFESKRTFAGVVASLVKKGYVVSTHSGTEEGFNAFQAGAQ